MTRRRHKQGGRHYYGNHSRYEQEDRQYKRELLEAQKGVFDDIDELYDEGQDDFLKEFEQKESLEKEVSNVTPEEPPAPPKKWYVVDTNLILSCVDIIYDDEDEDWRPPLKFKPNLEHAHIIIPYVVFEELNHIKEEKSLRGMIARIAFDRLGKIFPNSGRTLKEIGSLAAPISTGWKDQTISLMPLPRDFAKSLPWTPTRDDNDGWIAVTALVATMIRAGIDVGETTIHPETILKRTNLGRDVILLTNDKPLLSKADLFGVRVKSYSFEKRPIFSGCRRLTVPAEMFAKYFHEERLTREEFEAYMPNEMPLVANEYIIMEPENDAYPRSYFTVGIPFVNVARYHKENQMLYPLRFMKHEGRHPVNAEIACYYDALNDDKIQIVNVTGAAGTGKTYQAITHAIKSVKAGQFRRIIIIPSMSSKNQLGALPGDEAHKMEPMVAFCKDAIESYLASTPEFQKKREQLRRYGDVEHIDEDDEDTVREKPCKRKNGENRQTRRTRGDYTGSFEDFDYGDNDYIVDDYDEYHHKKKESKAYYPSKSEKKKAQENGESKSTYDQLLEKQVNYIYERYFKSFPYEQVQGRSFEDAIIILDEFQRVLIDDADTLITRPAKNSKLIICGDINQIHESSPEKQFKNGLNYARMLFFDWEGCANIHLTENMRGDITHVMTKNRRKVRRRMGQI
ncbi:PhoH family protein [Candidatus Saccharibacteria bacterium]|nr:PhoH family protein [Candidatus Saccharibacteria bacterium]